MSGLRSNGRKLRLMTYIVPGLPLELYQSIQYHLEETLGVDTLLVVESRWSCPPRDRADPFTADEADVVFMCCPGYLRMRAENNEFVSLCPAAPVFDHVQNPEGRPVYFTDVIVRNDVIPQRNSDQRNEVNCSKSTIDVEQDERQDHSNKNGICQSSVELANGCAPDDVIDPFLSLRGCRWAVNDCESLSGHFSTLLELKKRGLRPDFFSTSIFSGGHNRSIQMILSGDVDAAGVDSNTLRLWRATHPSLSPGIRVLTSWGPFPVYPVVLNTRLPEELRDGVAKALLEIGASKTCGPELARHGLAGFTHVTDEFYTKETAILDVMTSSNNVNI